MGQNTNAIDEFVGRKFKNGETLQEIANELGVSRQMIGLRIKRLGLVGNDGGAAVKIKKKAQLKEKQKKAMEVHRTLKFESLFGCSAEDITSINGRMFRWSQRSSIGYKYLMQKKNAADRGIEWKFNLKEWHDVWVASGKLEFRGLQNNGYVMARFGDVGPYAKDNVYICTSSQNIKDSYTNYPAKERKGFSGLIIEYAGLKMNLSQWAKKTGINRATLQRRIENKWPIDLLLTVIPAYGNKVALKRNGKLINNQHRWKFISPGNTADAETASAAD